MGRAKGLTLQKAAQKQQAHETLRIGLQQGGHLGQGAAQHPLSLQVPGPVHHRAGQLRGQVAGEHLEQMGRVGRAM